MKDSDLAMSPLESRLFEGFADTSDKRYVFLCNMQKDISRWSKNAVDYFGMPGEYMQNVSRIWAERIHPEDRQAFISDIDDIFAGKKEKHRLDYRAMNKNGEYVICTCHGKVIKGGEGESDLFLGTIDNHGIADNVDAATNLYNIYGFIQQLKQLKENNITAVEMLIGINSFAEINDIYSYSFGDKVLREVGSKLQSIVGHGCKVFRMNGVRFACCIRDRQIAAIYDLYRRMQYEMKYNVIVDGERIPITICAGAVLLSGDYDELSVQGSASYALEQSKHRCHGELYVFDDSMKGTKRRKLELITALRRSMINRFQGFYMCYQPLISSDNEKLIGAEALLRWSNDEFGEVSPGVFIPLIENDPGFFELGNWILRRSLCESRMIVEKIPEFILNVNISNAQLSHPLFRESVKAIIAETEFPAKNLCMELTESCRQLEKQHLVKEIEYLRSLGISIAIDDFGTGFSSLDLLSDLPVETLKFDRGFTRDIMTNVTNQSIIKAISQCAHELHVHVCLEGMETREMIDFTKRYSIYSYQGYYYSKPIIMQQFLKLFIQISETI